MSLLATRSGGMGRRPVVMDLRLEKVLEALYYEIVDNLPSDVCRDCPLVRMLGDLTGTVKHENNAMVAEKMGIDGTGIRCPCAGKGPKK